MTSLAWRASEIGLLVNDAHLGCVSSITKMLSDNTMQAAVSSENCGLFTAPTAS